MVRGHHERQHRPEARSGAMTWVKTSTQVKAEPGPPGLG
jgi:hypothetical protein